MRVIELLDKVLPYEFVFYNYAIFSTDKEAYVVYFNHSTDLVAEICDNFNVRPDPDVVEISFGLQNANTHNLSYGIANVGNAASVFSTVVAIIIEFLKKERDVKFICYSAKEQSRVKLYATMTTSIIRKFPMLKLIKQFRDNHGDYAFVLQRK